MGKILDFLYDFHFHQKHKNVYWEQVQDQVFLSLWYKALQSDNKQESRETKEAIKKKRGF